MIPREVVSLMSRRRIVAEVRTETAMQALSVVDALAVGGVTTIEISLTIPGAREILGHLATRQDVLVGAGAVLDGQQARDAIAAGARFIASPVFNPELAAICQEASVTCVLGALTPSEIIGAQRAGAEMVKLFPAEALGGPMYVRALLRQLTHMSLQISGGFTAEHMIEYLELPIRSLALGTLLAPRVLVERANWQALTNRARAFVDY
ncbi:MAG TPA: bifunctional 4-hydroxy-2-oxoglutarate aldolase/2-dehydro-3-deoxy-phosphogluconate aldolase, partial [Ktedonobacterales bacterium]|nr:bifunctional 4-hydroxy-2-oxoglutarate aldolase/2-dehydro-3-deoxy-phosphogluconate aldolase [Ktedonobacterales bacterium]